MKNAGYVIRISTRNGTTQSYFKVGDQWMKTSSSGSRPLSAEQLLSHLLPPLAGDQDLSVKVEHR